MTSVSIFAPEATVKIGGSSGAPQAAQADRPRRPDHDHVAAQIVARLIELPRRAVVLAEDETHLNLLPHVRANWTLRTARPQIPTPDTNRQVTVFGAIEVSTGRWVHRLGRRCAADFIALLDQVLRAFPRSPVIAVICDNDSIHHARKVTAYLVEHPRLELLYGARYRPHDNPAERIWAALTNYLANTAVTWPGRLRQIHSFFRNPHPARCWPLPRPGPAPGYRPVRSRTSGMRLVGAVLVEIHDEWQVGERRYLSEGSMALLIKPPASSDGLATPALLKA